MLWRVVLDSEMGSYFLDLKVHFYQVIGDFAFCFGVSFDPIYTCKIRNWEVTSKEGKTKVSYTKFWGKANV